MNNQFGFLLKKLIDESDTKANIISAKLGYDPTYISKWITGKNLPSEKSIDAISDKLSQIFSNLDNAQKIRSDLLSAYYSDLGFSTLENDHHKDVSFITSSSDVVHLIMEVLERIHHSGVEDITIHSTTNLLQKLEHHMETLVSKLHSLDLRKLEINTSMLPSLNKENALDFCHNFLLLTSGEYFVDFNIFTQKPDSPQFLVINDAVAINIVDFENTLFLAYYSFDKKFISDTKHHINLVSRGQEKILSYVKPDYLKRTNVQLNHFLQDYQTVLFSESPSILIPKNIMNHLIESNKLNLKGEEWNEQISYLTQVSNIFERHTKEQHVKILIYESNLAYYINTGRIEIGGKKYQLSKEQVKEHILYIADCMRENENIEFYSILDTIDFNQARYETPSIFLTPQSISIGRTTIYNDETSYNFYFSTEDDIIKSFELYVNSIQDRSYCVQLSPERLAAYID